MGDGRRRGAGREEAHPVGVVVAGNALLGDGGHVGQLLGAFGVEHGDGHQQDEDAAADLELGNADAEQPQQEFAGHGRGDQHDRDGGRRVARRERAVRVTVADGQRGDRRNAEQRIDDDDKADQRVQSVDQLGDQAFHAQFRVE